MIRGRLDDVNSFSDPLPLVRIAVHTHMFTAHHPRRWTLIDVRTVRVYFGEWWERDRPMYYTGSVGIGDLSGVFEYTSSAGVRLSEPRIAGLRLREAE
jgi:hypothetical protein